MKKREHSKRAGFTLIELLVVIAILAILVAVGVPVYTGYISRANDAAVSTELGAILTAAEAANATNYSKITAISINSDGEITVELEDDSTLSERFYDDFAAYYGIARTDIGDNTSIVIGSLSTLFNKSETYKNGAEWKDNAWSALGTS